MSELFPSTLFAVLSDISSLPFLYSKLSAFNSPKTLSSLSSASSFTVYAPLNLYPLLNSETILGVKLKSFYLFCSWDRCIGSFST